MAKAIRTEKTASLVIGLVFSAFFMQAASAHATQGGALPLCTVEGKISDSWSGKVMLLDEQSGWVIGYYNDVDISLNNVSLDPSYSPRLSVEIRIDEDGSVGRAAGWLLLGTATGDLSGGFISDWRYQYSYDGIEESFDPTNMNLSMCEPTCSKLGSAPTMDVTRDTLRTDVAVPFKANAYNKQKEDEKFSVTADLSQWPEVHDILIAAYDQALAKLQAGECRRW